MEKAILNNKNIPHLNGLVLAGGKSSRMGKPKDQINWNGKEQKYFAADLLQAFCKEVFISSRHDQTFENEEYKFISDTFLGMGPLGGILSALRSDREKAWLVIACDLPLLNKQTLDFLIQNRDASKLATTFKSPFDGLPEPLITIWEPNSYPKLLEFLGKGMTCPRKVLINNDVRIIDSPFPEALMNVNTPQEASEAAEILKSIKK